MREREEFRVKQLLNIINPNEKTIVFIFVMSIHYDYYIDLQHVKKSKI